MQSLNDNIYNSNYIMSFKNFIFLRDILYSKSTYKVSSEHLQFCIELGIYKYLSPAYPVYDGQNWVKP